MVGAWIQIDLTKSIVVTGIITQGREDGDSWVTSFEVLYGNDPSNLQNIMQQPTGNMVCMPYPF